MVNRKRDIQLHFMVSEQEHDSIKIKMSQVGTKNMGAYLRKMAIDGYIVKLDMQGLQNLLTQLGRFNNNVNQIAKRTNETKRIYIEDMEDIRAAQDRIWDSVRELITKISSI